MSRIKVSLKFLTLALAATTLTLLATGCAMVDNAGDTNAFSTPGTMTGMVHGGNLPISNSTVKLYAVGTTGYGSAGTLLATTTTSKDGHAAFQFTQVTSGATGPSGNTYICPSSTTLLYIIATGGDPLTNNGTNNNTAAVFLAAVGACGTSGSAVVIVNEVTSVASVWALQQYMNPGTTSGATTSVGSPNTTQAKLGLSNTFAIVPFLATSGVANATFTPTSTFPGAVVTGTPENSKINTIANILASCVNYASAGSAPNCTTLFANAVAQAPSATSTTNSSFPVAGDTLQAAYYMATNAVDSNATDLGNLYALQAASGAPFQPTLSAAPSDWTVGVTYGSTSEPNSTVFLLTDPEHVAIDAQGNVWLANFGTTSAGSSITELSPTGGALNQVLTTIYGANRNLAIDPTGNVWLPVSYGLVGSTVTSGKGTTVYEYTTGGATNIFVTGNDPASIAFDGVGNAFVIEPSFANTTTASGGTSTGTLEEIPASSANGTVATTIATNVYTDFSSLSVDSNYTIWITGGGTVVPGTAAGGLDGMYQFLKNSGTGTGYPSAPTATAVGSTLAGDTVIASLTEPESALAIDSSGNVLAGNFSKSTVGGIAGTSTTTLTSAPNVPITTTGETSPQFMVVDGAGNIWMAQASSTGTVYEYSSAATTGVALSPTGGFVHTYKEPYGIAVDPSGNVWVGNEGATATSTVAGFVTEIVGAAVPVVTPIAAGLPTTAGGTNKLGTKP